MYRKIDDFIKDWKYESDSTIKIFNTLTEESLNYKVNDDGRALGYIAWHIVHTLGEMGTRAKLDVEAPGEDVPMPTSVLEIVSSYEKAADSLLRSVLDRWNDEALLGEIEMYGDKWTRGSTLSILIKHQAHHRGQMTILMRQAGLKVSGVYGPSREEWSQYNLPPMK